MQKLTNLNSEMRQYLAEWSETRRHMVHDELVPMDFTTNTLQIRTDNHSEKPWLKWIFVQFFESPDVSFGGFRIDLASNPPSWEVMNCNSAQRFSESLPASSSRIWTVGWDADNYRYGNTKLRVGRELNLGRKKELGRHIRVATPLADFCFCSVLIINKVSYGVFETFPTNTRHTSPQGLLFSLME